jgi:transcriptional regulator with XRE-family HTH domain
MTSGQYIKSAREKKKLTQAQLAKVLGFKTLQFVSILERNKARVPSYLIKPICEALGMDRKILIKLILFEIEKSFMEGSK